MSTWISKPPLLALAGALLLAGCLEGAPFGSGRAAPEVVQVAGGAVAIRGQRGYCVDPVATRDGADGAFVLLGSCASLSAGGRSEHPGRVAVLTASVVGDAEAGGIAGMEEALAAHFRTEAGRAMLSRTGDAGRVTVQDLRSEQGALILRVRDTSPFSGAAVGEEYVRAIFDLGGQIVTLTVIPLAAQPMEPQALSALLNEFRARVLHESAATPAADAT